MQRLLILILTVMFAATSAFATPMAVCQHADAHAHAMALRSTDSIAAAQAQGEEIAQTAAKAHAMANATASALAGAILPAGPALLSQHADATLAPWPSDERLLTGRTDTPASPPPLA